MGAGGDGAEAREKGDTVGHPRKGKVASPTDAPTVHSYSHQAGDSSQQRHSPADCGRAREIPTA